MSEPSFSYDVFLSHPAQDKAVMRPLAERLRQDGLKVWFDEWALQPEVPRSHRMGARSGVRAAKIDPPPLGGYGATRAELEHSRVLVL